MRAQKLGGLDPSETDGADRGQMASRVYSADMAMGVRIDEA